MKKKPVYYKTLDYRGMSTFGGGYRWPLPVKDQDGKWLPGDWAAPIVGKLSICHRGYHVCTQDGLIHWLAPRLFVAEVKRSHTRMSSYGKVAYRNVRLVRELDGWDNQVAMRISLWAVIQVAKAEDDPKLQAVIDCLEEEMAKENPERSEIYEALRSASGFNAARVRGYFSVMSRPMSSLAGEVLLEAAAAMAYGGKSSEYTERKASYEKLFTRKLFEMIGEPYIETPTDPDAR